MSSSQPQVWHRMELDSSEDILWYGSTNDLQTTCTAKLNPNMCTSPRLATCYQKLEPLFPHLSGEVESFYFKFLLTEFIDYEHARSSLSAGDQNHVRTIGNVGSLEKFLNQAGTFQQKPAESLRSCKYTSKLMSHILSLR